MIYMLASSCFFVNSSGSVHQKPSSLCGITKFQSPSVRTCKDVGISTAMLRLMIMLRYKQKKYNV